MEGAAVILTSCGGRQVAEAYEAVPHLRHCSIVRGGSTCKDSISSRAIACVMPSISHSHFPASLLQVSMRRPPLPITTTRDPRFPAALPLRLPSDSPTALPPRHPHPSTSRSASPSPTG